MTNENENDCFILTLLQIDFSGICEYGGWKTNCGNITLKISKHHFINRIPKEISIHIPNE